eukprot:COSAG06_NODE_59347_length_274_cov_0.885714_2_plen_20_part_01
MENDFTLPPPLSLSDLHEFD